MLLMSASDLVGGDARSSVPTDAPGYRGRFSAPDFLCGFDLHTGQNPTHRTSRERRWAGGPGAGTRTG
jgi:hypothetical protein